MSSPTLTPYATKEPETCKCEHHAVIHPVSGVYPPCKYAEQLSLAINSKGEQSYEVQKLPQPDKIILMEDNGFFIDKNQDGTGNPHDPHESWIGHACPSSHWKIYLDEKAMMEYGVCIECMMEVPPGLIALWKMHNWKYLQQGHTYGDEDAWASCAARNPNAPPVWLVPELGDDENYIWRGLI